MNATSTLKAYSRIAILIRTLLILLGLAQGVGAERLSQVNQTGTDSKRKTQITNDGILLEEGKPIEREIAVGQIEQYRLTLTEGGYVRIVVEQKGVDVMVELFGPDGKKLDEVDGLDGRYGIDALSLIAVISGSYRVEVHPLPEEVLAGRYEIKVADLRIATEQDQKRVLAGKADRQGNLLQREGTAESFGKAIEKYQGALQFHRDVGDQREEAITLNHLGAVHYLLGERQKALDYYNQALPIRRIVSDRQGEAATLGNIGEVYMMSGERQKALDYYNQALPISRAVGDRRGEAKILSNIGGVYDSLGERQKALDYYNQALPISQAIGDRRGGAETLNKIGMVYRGLGETQKALVYYNQALPIRRAVGDRRGEATTLTNIGSLYNLLGEKQKALVYFEQALPLRRVVGDRQGEASTLSNIGLTYDSLGEKQKALDYYNQALPINRAVGDRPGEARTLNNIGGVYSQLGEKQKALDYYNQALSIKRAVGDREGEAITLSNIGAVYNSLGEKQKALEYYDQVLLISRGIGDRLGEARMFHNIGRVYDSLGEKQKALDYYNQALPIIRAIGHREGEANTLSNIGLAYTSLGEKQKALDYYNQALQLWRILNSQGGEATTLYRMASLARASDNLSEARSQIEAVLKIVESLRTKVASPELRTSYFASVQEYYEFYIDLLGQLHQLDPSQGHDRAALQASERARARSLLELLTEARADIRRGADPVLLERERSLLGQLNAAIEKRTRLLGRQHSPEEVAAAGKQIDAVTSEYEQVQAQIRLKSPRYDSLTQPSLLSLKEIQQLLDPDTVLLEYSLGKERSFLWLVATTSMASFVLPKRKEIEVAVKDVLNLLTESGTPEEFEAKAAQVGQMLLGPVASKLGKKRLAIVADGLLQYLPFAALTAPMAGANKYRPLIVDHEIVNLPSASALATLRSQFESRKPAPKSIAILADPVFSQNDQRVASNTNAAVVLPAEQGLDKVTRSARKLGLLRDGDNWARLPFSRQEAEQIIALTPKSEAKLALDFNANLSTATAPEIGEYRILHFATHALFNDETPELSGLVLSLVNEKGEPRNGFLSLPEVFNLNLAADLVVLSACQTGLGKDIRGEGLVGLTRGFMYAGAPRIVASLWVVRDKDALELMVRFYSAILKERLRPAAALRKAQLSMWREGPRSAKRWSGFVFQGEWR